MQETQETFDPWVGKIAWSRKWHPSLVVLPGKVHGRRAWWAYSSRGHKESGMTEHTHTHRDATITIMTANMPDTILSALAVSSHSLLIRHL